MGSRLIILHRRTGVAKYIPLIKKEVKILLPGGVSSKVYGLDLINSEGVGVITYQCRQDKFNVVSLVIEL